MSVLSRFTQSTGIFPSEYAEDFPLEASTVLRSNGGRYVTAASGNYGLTEAADTRIDGWVESPVFRVVHDGNQGTTPFTSSSTAGLDVAKGTTDIHQDRFAFWMPAATGDTLSDSLKGTLCDLALEGSAGTTTQVVATTVTTNKVVKILGVDAPNGIVLVTAVK